MEQAAEGRDHRAGRGRVYTRYGAGGAEEGAEGDILYRFKAGGLHCGKCRGFGSADSGRNVR